MKGKFGVLSALVLSLVSGGLLLAYAGPASSRAPSKIAKTRNSGTAGSSVAKRVGTTGKSAKRAAGSGSATMRKVLNRHAGEPVGSDAPTDGTNTSSTTSNAEKSCRSEYAACMDLQIRAFINKYPYLADDESVQFIQESADPLRCIYYDANTANGLFTTSGNLRKYCTDEEMAERTQATIDLTGTAVQQSSKFNNLNVCANQRDVNDLYLAYNYFCDLEFSTLQASKLPVKRCSFANNSTDGNPFATKYGAAYYREAYLRVQNGELKIINFEQTKLYKDKIKAVLEDCELDPGYWAGQEYEGINGYSAKEATKDCAEKALKTWEMFSLTTFGLACPAGYHYTGTCPENTTFDGVKGKCGDGSKPADLSSLCTADTPPTCPNADIGNTFTTYTVNTPGTFNTTTKACSNGATPTYPYEVAPITGEAEGNVADELLADLGLDTTEGEIFSINVPPPMGAGSLDPAGLFRKASDLCFSGIKLGTAEKNLYGSATQKQLQESVDKLRRCTGSVVERKDLERYYVAGTWVIPCEEGYNYNETAGKCISEDDNTNRKDPMTMEELEGSADIRLEETTFMSAKKSCDQYEQTLMSSRNNIYGRFDTALKNYLEDNIAKMIAKKAAAQQTIADSFMSLKQLTQDLEMGLLKMKTDAYKQKSQALMDIMQADLDLDTLRQTMTMQEIEHAKQRTLAFATKYQNEITAACLTKVRAVFVAACMDANGNPWGSCGASDARKFMTQKPGSIFEIANGIANQSVYINKDGQIRSRLNDQLTSVSGSSGTIQTSITDDGNDSTHNTMLIDQGKMDGFERVYCTFLPNFKTSIVNPIRADFVSIYDYILKSNCGGVNSDDCRNIPNANCRQEPTETCTSNTYNNSRSCTTTYETKCDTLNTCSFGSLEVAGRPIAEVYEWDTREKEEVVAASSSDCGKDCTSRTAAQYEWRTEHHETALDYTVDNVYLNADGKCYQDMHTNNPAAPAGQRKITRLVPDFETEYVGRGAEVFDNLILPALNLQGNADK